MNFKDFANYYTCLRFFFAFALVLSSFAFFELRTAPLWNSGRLVTTVPKRTWRGGNKICSDQWPFNLELFIPVPPNDHGLEELKLMAFPTLGLFWPVENLRLLLLTDGEAGDAAFFADRLRQTANDYLSGVNGSICAKTRVLYNFPTLPIGGWHRQQWLMFWADNFTSADYIGFLDSDAVFVTRVVKTDLFVGTKPIVRSLYGKPNNDWWTQVSRLTYETIGRLEPFTCMSYFPVIIKHEHLKLIREHIRQQLKKATFDEAFEYMVSQGTYSQFTIMCAYIWYYKRQDYYWIVGEREPGWNGPFALGQVTSLHEAEINETLLRRPRPAISIHWNYESFINEPGAMKNVIRTGICYSMTENDDARPNYCSGLVNRTEFNKYEWTFEGYTFFSDRSLGAHLDRLRLIERQCCPHKWNHQLISDLTS